jgi:hypothetical protein
MDLVSRIFLVVGSLRFIFDWILRTMGTDSKPDLEPESELTASIRTVKQSDELTSLAAH